MCGNIYVMRKDGLPAYKAVLKRYRNQKQRGSQGFGYIAIKNNRVVAYERAQYEDEIIQKLQKEDAPEIMFHHRAPTSTPNVREAAHPIYVTSEHMEFQYFLNHNGVIRNTKELKKKHEEEGFVYSTELELGFKVRNSKQYYHFTDKEPMWNDSESIAIETALALDGKKETIATEGAAACIGLQVQKDQVVKRFFFRNLANPLVFNSDKHMITITSLGKGEEVDTTGVFELNIADGTYAPIGQVKPPPSYVVSTFPYWKKEEDKVVRVWNRETHSYEVPPIPLPGKRTIFSHEDDADRDMRTLKEIDADIEAHLREGRKELFNKMTVEELYDSYHLNYEDEKSLQDRIESVDTEVKSHGINAERMVARKRLADQLLSVQRYQTQLGDEIDTRTMYQIPYEG